MKDIHTLYLCYFGLREPLVQTQVLPYLRQIRKDGVKFSLLTFEPNPKEKWTKEEVEIERGKLADEGIDWHFLTYHKSPSIPATLYDVFCGVYFTWKFIRREKVDVLHARVQLPALIGVLARKLSRTKPKLIFDIRGFFPEEYMDAGLWKKNGWLYRTVKRNEKWLLKEADAFVVLTEKARQILFPESAETGFDKFGRPIEVIPCCVDLKRFVTANKTSRTEIRKKYKLENRQVITYIGSFGGWYLADEMADLLKVAREKDNSTFALILTQSSPEIMAERLKERGFANEDFLVTKVPHGEIPKYLSASDIALSFIKPCFSKLSSSPTKIAEYLASGIPVITNSGVGDVLEVIEKHQTGAVVQDFSRESYIESLQKIGELRRTNDLYEKCVISAKEEFDLEEVGGLKYRLIYKRLSSKSLIINTNTLYLCYFGLREPLVQTQVLPYLREIKKIDNLKVSLLTFEPDYKEKWTAEQIEAEKKKLAEENITWHCLPYHKRPSAPATVYDIFCGAWLVWRLMRHEKIDILHARVHVPAILGLIARNFSRHKPKLLFDIRGFVPEEYTDAGVWKENGWIYKISKQIEKWILRESDGFIVLTENAREILFPESAETGFDKLGRPVEVIPCCVDFEKRFQGNQDELRKKTRDELKLNDRLVITHLGALGGLYLTEDIANFLQAAKSKYPNTFASFLTQTSPDLIITLLKERGFTEEDFFVGKISPTEVQRYLSASDIGLSFVKATYATASRSPTKIPEYLACGLPIVSNRGVGDVDELIIEENVGILLNDFSSESYADALKQVITLGNDANFINKCRICAKNKFDLEKVGGERYRRIYNHLLNGFS